MFNNHPILIVLFRKLLQLLKMNHPQLVTVIVCVILYSVRAASGNETDHGSVSSALGRRHSSGGMSRKNTAGRGA